MDLIEKWEILKLNVKNKTMIVKDAKGNFARQMTHQRHESFMANQLCSTSPFQLKDCGGMETI